MDERLRAIEQAAQLQNLQQPVLADRINLHHQKSSWNSQVQKLYAPSDRSSPQQPLQPTSSISANQSENTARAAIDESGLPAQHRHPGDEQRYPTRQHTTSISHFESSAWLVLGVYAILYLLLFS